MVTLVVGINTSNYYQNETASTTVFVDYWAVVKISFFIFGANIFVEVLFLMFVGTLSQSF